MKDTGGAAFPTKGGMVFYFPEDVRGQIEKVRDEIENSTGGMTLRDWFAGQALIGLVNYADNKDTVEVAYKLADAMIAERSK